MSKEISLIKEKKGEIDVLIETVVDTQITKHTIASLARQKESLQSAVDVTSESLDELIAQMYAVDQKIALLEGKDES